MLHQQRITTATKKSIVLLSVVRLPKTYIFNTVCLEKILSERLSALGVASASLASTHAQGCSHMKFSARQKFIAARPAPHNNWMPA